MRTIIIVIAASCQLLVSGCAIRDGLFASQRNENAESLAQSMIAVDASKADPEKLEGSRIIRLDNIGKLKITGPVTIQTGTGNTSANTKTDNTGRAAQSGANGGHSEATTTTKVPAWAISLVLAVGVGLGAWGLSRWQRWRAPPAPT